MQVISAVTMELAIPKPSVLVTMVGLAQAASIPSRPVCTTKGTQTTNTYCLFQRAILFVSMEFATVEFVLATLDGPEQIAPKKFVRQSNAQIEYSH